jgi:ABC-type oligopeptide transport system substrate-binding subunit
MKKTIGMFAVFAGLALAAASAFGQAAASDCSEEGKAALYTDFTANRTSDQAKAYEAGKKYLARNYGSGVWQLPGRG